MKPPCPSRIVEKNGKRVDIEWDSAAKQWRSVTPPPGSRVFYCDGDKDHEGTCCGARTKDEYLHLLRQSKGSS